MTFQTGFALDPPAERSLILAGAVDWKEIEFVLESADQEVDRPYADGWETIRFEIEDEDAEEPEV